MASVAENAAATARLHLLLQLSMVTILHSKYRFESVLLLLDLKPSITQPEMVEKLSALKHSPT